MDQLFSIYHVDEKIGFNVERFQHLSSALLHELESNVCLTEVQNPDKPFRAGKNSFRFITRDFGLI